MKTIHITGVTISACEATKTAPPLSSTIHLSPKQCYVQHSEIVQTTKEIKAQLNFTTI